MKTVKGVLVKIRNQSQLIHELVRYRKYRKWSQRQLSEETGISQQAISKIENNKVDPTLTTVFKMLSALEVDLKISDRIYD